MDRHSDLVVRSSSPDDTAAIAHVLGRTLVAGDVLVLGGDLGAGKTTFVKALGAALGIDETITSPTFTLAQQYEGGRLLLHHLDVYRIAQLDEVVDLALPELYESGGAVVIEWGETIAPALPAGYLLLRFEFGDGDDDRSLEFVAVGPDWFRRMAQLRDELGDLVADGRDR